MTAVGRVRLARTYRIVGGVGSCSADDHLGITGLLSRGAERLATLAGLQRSFAQAESLLQEFCGWKLDDNTIRKLTHRTAKRATATRADRGDAERFAAAAGDPEVAIDAGKVNTLGGWRDVKMGVFSRRKPGEPATPAEWDTRTLPPPTIRSVIAAIEPVEAFTTRVRTETDRLNLTTAANTTVLADGGEWIWNLAAMVLPLAAGVLDIYHALQHLADAVTTIWGSDAADAKRRRGAGTQVVLAAGKAGIDRWIAQSIAEVPDGTSTAPLLAFAAYLARHQKHLEYADRLAQGRSIGSGQVEGAIKELVNLRLKRTGARWKVEHVGPLVELLALSQTPEWNDLWTAA